MDEALGNVFYAVHYIAFGFIDTPQGMLLWQEWAALSFRIVLPPKF